MGLYLWESGSAGCFEVQLPAGYQCFTQIEAAKKPICLQTLSFRGRLGY